MRKSILVTGGAGFQGSHLVEALVKQGHRVTVLNTHSDQSQHNLSGVYRSIEVIWGSVTDKEVVEKSVRNKDVVFHLAGHIHVDESIAHPLATVMANVIGTTHVLEAVRGHLNRLIFVSTCEVYGEMEKDQPIAETKELKPQSPYAASKAAADRLCYAYVRTYGLDITIVRPFNVYGPRQKHQGGGALIPILVHKALAGEPLVVYGSGDQTRDYIYIDDLIQGYLLTLEHPELRGQVINFGTGHETKVIDIVRRIAEKTGSEFKQLPARPGEVSRFIANIDKARALGFNPQVDIWTGIDRYLVWARENYSENAL